MRANEAKIGGWTALLGRILGLVCLLWASSVTAQTPGANATLASVGSGEYALSLNNTGSTTIGTLWYAWLPGEDFMASSPTNVLSPPGWTDTITGGGVSDGYAIRWTATSSASYLPAGNALSGFSFDSTQTLTQLTTANSPFFPTTQVGTSVAYYQGAFSGTGETIVVQPVPEPSTAALTAIAGVVLVGTLLRRRRARTS